MATLTKKEILDSLADFKKKTGYVIVNKRKPRRKVKKGDES